MVCFRHGEGLHFSDSLYVSHFYLSVTCEFFGIARYDSRTLEQGATVGSGESCCKMKPWIPRVQEARIAAENSHVTNISTNRQDGEPPWP